MVGIEEEKLEGLQILPFGHYMQAPGNSVSEHEELVRETHMKLWLQTDPLWVKIQGCSQIGK